MFDVAPTELLLVAVVAVLVLGPKELPRALYKFGQVIGKARGMARHFRTGLDAMVREAELEELQKQWEQQNQRIMAETPAREHEAESAPAEALALPDPDAAPAPSEPVDAPANPPVSASIESEAERKPGQSVLPLDTPAAPVGSRHE